MSEKLPKSLRVRIGDRWYSVQVEDLEGDTVRVLVDGEPVEVTLGRLPSAGAPQTKEPQAQLETTETTNLEAPVTRAASAAGAIRSPMPGVIVAVPVKVGDQVVAGDEVCVLEAMKMRQILRADRMGIIVAVFVEPGDHVQDGQPIVELE